MFCSEQFCPIAFRIEHDQRWAPQQRGRMLIQTLLLQLGTNAASNATATARTETTRCRSNIPRCLRFRRHPMTQSLSLGRAKRYESSKQTAAIKAAASGGPQGGFLFPVTFAAVLATSTASRSRGFVTDFC